jgi:CcmD family protein
MVSGGTLLVEAYCALWLILLAFLLVSWRRQGQIDQRVDELEKALARGAPK